MGKDFNDKAHYLKTINISVHTQILNERIKNVKVKILILFYFHNFYLIIIFFKNKHNN